MLRKCSPEIMAWRGQGYPEDLLIKKRDGPDIITDIVVSGIKKKKKKSKQIIKGVFH
jgi:hypothetical protein